MGNAAWKDFERWVAKELGGQRRGAHTGSGTKGSGKSDVILPGFSIECKKLKEVSRADVMAALEQANFAKEGRLEIPVAFLARKGSPYRSATAVMNLEDYVTVLYHASSATQIPCHPPHLRSDIVIMYADAMIKLLRFAAAARGLEPPRPAPDLDR